MEKKEMTKKEKRIAFIVMEGMFFVGLLMSIGNIIGILVCILSMITVFVMLNSDFIAEILGKKIITKVTLETIKNDIHFYRDIIDKYSIGELSFIDGHGIDYPNDIIAMLLKLKKKDYIEIDDKIIIKNNNYEDLKKSEKYLMNSIIDGNIILDNNLILNKIIKKESEEDNLLNDKKFDQHKLFMIIFFSFILIIILLFLIDYLSTFLKINIKINSDILAGLIPVIFFIFIFAVIVSISYLSIGKKLSWKLTKEGTEIRKKLEGLKMFLKDFTNIDKREINEIILWDDYLIYSVIFGLNKDIINKYKNNIIIKNETNSFEK